MRTLKASTLFKDGLRKFFANRWPAEEEEFYVVHIISEMTEEKFPSQFRKKVVCKKQIEAQDRMILLRTQKTSFGWSNWMQVCAHLF